jgi:hypothetical protein
MQWAFDSKNADFCQEIYNSYLKEKRIVLKEDLSPAVAAAWANSPALFRWVVQHGCGFDPERIFVLATKMGKLDFVRWFHEQYGQPLSFAMAERLVKEAIFGLSDDDEEMAILKYCLSLWRARRRAGDTATVPSRVLKWTARYDNWRALRWCAEQCASTDLEGLVLECKDYPFAGKVLDIVQNLKMNE